jgi:hypothetical protein
MFWFTRNKFVGSYFLLISKRSAVSGAVFDVDLILKEKMRYPGSSGKLK